MHETICKFVCHGAPEDMSDLDMFPSENGRSYANIDTYVQAIRPKTVYFGVDPREPLRAGNKMMKIMFKATVYSDNGKPVSFRLVNKDGKPVRGAVFQVSSKTPVDMEMKLPIGNDEHHVTQKFQNYYIQGKAMGEYSAKPICKRFSLSVVYV